jgi:hypothetical protein
VPRRTLETVAIGLAVAAAFVALQNAALGVFFPRLDRLTTDFSPAYVRRELARLTAEREPTIFLGDSVLWGYHVDASRTAPGLLRARGCACRNLAFKSGSPPNDYALVRLLERAHVRPRAVVLQINPKVFSEADPAYRTLHPALAELAGPLLSPAERDALAPPPRAAPAASLLDRVLVPASVLYAMRADIRETLYGDADAAPAKDAVSAEMFQASYDLTPLDERNLGVRFLTKTLDALRGDRVPVVAFMTPTNHALLHEYIDNAEYRANGAYLRRLLARHGARVLDLDAAFPAAEFIDNDHLTAAGHRRLAAALAPALPR